MLTTRVQEAVATSEREALLKYTGLCEEELVNVRLEREPLPTVDLRDWDGIIMCGSHFDVSAPEEKKTPEQKRVETGLLPLLEEVLEEDFPLLGICYGLGLTTKLLGGVVGPDISEDITAPELTVTTEGAEDPILDGIPRRFQAYVGHHESVIKAPQQLVPLVTGDIAPLQMGRVGQNMYLTQFHPELDLDGISVRIEVFADAGYYPQDERSLVEARVREANVAPAHRILSNFVNRFSESSN